MTDDAHPHRITTAPAHGPAGAPSIPATPGAGGGPYRKLRVALLVGSLAAVAVVAALIGACFMWLSSLEREGVGTPSFGPGTHARPATQPGWIARYNGPGNGGDSARALAVDRHGNVYVTGISYGGASTAHDFATVKYAPDGTEVWIARYNGPANRDDQAIAIAVDPQGNVVVTGYSDGGSSGLDYATVKYAPDGAQLWVARYNSPAGDEPMAIAAPADGSVIVTGQSGGDYATVKYGADGAQLWLDVFDGKDATGPLGTPSGQPSLAVDTSGNAYVSGTMTRLAPGFTSILGTGMESQDYLIIKYRPDGRRDWATTYDGPPHDPGRFAIDDVRQPVDDQATAIAVDATGAVYVTGSSDKNFRTIKYDSNGHQLWVTAYDGPSDSTDEPRALGVAPDGSVYVTGLSCCGNGLFLVVLKYRPDGRLLWARRVDEDGDDVPKGMAIDGNGDVAVTADTTWSVFFSGDYADYLVAKFGSDGTWEWFAKYDGPGERTDSPGGVAFGPNGYVYVTGTSDGGDTDHDFATIEYRR